MIRSTGQYSFFGIEIRCSRFTNSADFFVERLFTLFRKGCKYDDTNQTFTNVFIALWQILLLFRDKYISR
jgi:hypothetical protein